ncbi:MULTISPECIES: PAS domain S-box protein [unclassified Methanoregula]|uniref:PAS domain S-box protein n=1 Tax=unclassified Methanoregula TaxID=2649730 RepID=UPI0009D27F7B|nr:MULTISPECIES: PAS domain S-box protein [unclassified Methanoregula]OPX64126.1 MAG: sensory histidine kinase AtoS [Methanoregula sp. PtaB.Bin085]OPY34754.1 MAG: sensory histidine kinase AtoS [Methanoregula sp. PtaU1.Bin006]
MKVSLVSLLRSNPSAVPFLVALTLAISFAANFWGLLYGISIVIPHLFYVPIIIAAFFYPRRGTVFALVVSAAYFLMVILVRPGATADIVSAAARCVIFVFIALIISFLSERVAAREQALVRAQQEWENTFNGVPDLIAIIGTDHRILRVNKAMADSLGMNPGEAAGRLCYETVHASGTIPGNCPHALLLKDGKEHAAEIHEEKLGGDFLVTVSPLHDENGNLIGSIHVARDITERKQVEIELLLHSEILQNMAEGVALIRASDGRIVFTNTRFSQLFGYPEGELIGQPVSVLNAPDGRTPEAIAEEIEEKLDKYSIWAGEIRNRKKDGELFYCHAIVSTYIHPVYGKVWITVHEDITEQKRIQAALAGTEQRYRQLYEGMRDAFASVDLDGRITNFNTAFERLIGYTHDEIFRLSYQDLTPERWQAAEAEILRTQVMTRGYSDIYEKEYRRRDGTIVPVELRTALITGDDKSPQGMWAIIRDITPRKEAERALQESEEKYRTIINEIQDIFYRTDTEGRITMLSPSAAKLAGYDSLDQLIGKPVSMVYANPADREKLIAALQESGAVYAFPLDLRVSDGSIRHVTVSSHFFRDAKGTILGVEGVIHDITPLRQAEDALRESEERYRTIIETIEDVYFRFDGESRLVMVSPSAGPMFGYDSAKEMIGLHAADIWSDPAARIQMIETMRKQGGFVRDWEAELKKKDGSVFWASISGHMHHDRDGRYLGKEGIIRDITERKKMEDALKTALTKLNMLSSITRHDILNQIMGLRTFLELSREDLKGTKFEDYLQKGDLAAGAIQRQIEFTKFYQDIGVNAPKWQNAAEVIREAAGQLSIPASIGLKIEVGDVEVFADPLIVKVFFNLMENSLRHGERVTQMSFTSRASAEGLVITYRDNGTGISAEDKKMLFRKGFGKHTGLGLFLSREILAITGITITENGEPGKGVQFEMTVPHGAFRSIP